jgi:iron complex transport system ATP-binding protein
MVRTITRARNLTTIVTLHDPNLALRYCSRMVMMKQGRVHREGDAQDVFEEQALEAMYDMKVSIENGCSGNCFVTPAAVEGQPAMQRPECRLKRVL